MNTECATATDVPSWAEFRRRATLELHRISAAFASADLAAGFSILDTSPTLGDALNELWWLVTVAALHLDGDSEHDHGSSSTPLETCPVEVRRGVQNA